MCAVGAHAALTADPDRVRECLAKPTRWNGWLTLHKSRKGKPPAVVEGQGATAVRQRRPKYELPHGILVNPVAALVASQDNGETGTPDHAAARQCPRRRRTNKPLCDMAQRDRRHPVRISARLKRRLSYDRDARLRLRSASVFDLVRADEYVRAGQEALMVCGRHPA
ncbi:hypothetical protein GCM10010178_03430 [Lentzea flava]|uniref:Uncharacterized protein n=1 Tax=Lentzea flava TaxID=103732 RepID=A0ABQ2UAH2_9PSEU|nr:hypothetical protein GCM10010178_03430 [Lentzea flava]